MRLSGSSSVGAQEKNGAREDARCRCCLNTCEVVFLQYAVVSKVSVKYKTETYPVNYEVCQLPVHLLRGRPHRDGVLQMKYWTESQSFHWTQHHQGPAIRHRFRHHHLIRHPILHPIPLPKLEKCVRHPLLWG